MAARPAATTWRIAWVAMPDHTNADAPSSAAAAPAAIAAAQVGASPLSAVSMTARHGSSGTNTGAGIDVVVSNNTSPSRTALSCRLAVVQPPLTDAGQMPLSALVRGDRASPDEVDDRRQ